MPDVAVLVTAKRAISDGAVTFSGIYQADG